MASNFNFRSGNQDIKVLLLNPVAKNLENAVEDFSGLKPNNCSVSTIAAWRVGKWVSTQCQDLKRYPDTILPNTYGVKIEQK